MTPCDCLADVTALKIEPTDVSMEWTITRLYCNDMQENKGRQLRIPKNKQKYKHYIYVDINLPNKGDFDNTGCEINNRIIAQAD